MPKLKSRLSWLPVLLAALLPAAAVARGQHTPPQSSPQPPVATTTPPGPPLPLLWKVADADNAVYLLGAFHLLKPGDYPLSGDVDAAFADAQSLVFEMPPAEMASPQLALRMMQSAVRTDGTQLDGELPAATIAKLKAWQDANAENLGKIGLSAQRLQLFEPWFVAMMVSVIGMTEQGLDPGLGLDRHFAAAAAAARKPTSGFETGSEQIAFLDGMNRDEQLQYLDESLSQSATGAQELQQLHAAWRNGDEALIWNEMALPMRTRYPRLYQRINVERNDRWLAKIERMLAAPGSDDAMVVVGALHLLGEDGLVEKLRARGYGVERICSACNTAVVEKKAR